MRYLLLVLLLVSSARADMPKHFMDTLAQVESRDNPRAIGRLHGERSRLQMIRAIWRLYTSEPFSKATTDPQLAEAVAQTHLEYLRQKLLSWHIVPTPTRMAVAWHSGAAAVLRNHLTSEQHDYATRFHNLFEDTR